MSGSIDARSREADIATKALASYLSELPSNPTHNPHATPAIDYDATSGQMSGLTSIPRRADECENTHKHSRSFCWVAGGGCVSAEITPLYRRGVSSVTPYQKIQIRGHFILNRSLACCEYTCRVLKQYAALPRTAVSRRGGYGQCLRTAVLLPRWGCCLRTSNALLQPLGENWKDAREISRPHEKLEIRSRLGLT